MILILFLLDRSIKFTSNSFGIFATDIEEQTVQNEPVCYCWIFSFSLIDVRSPSVLISFSKKKSKFKLRERENIPTSVTSKEKRKLISNTFLMSFAHHWQVCKYLEYIIFVDYEEKKTIIIFLKSFQIIKTFNDLLISQYVFVEE